MSLFRSYITLFLTLLPILVSADCSACDSYTNALQSCQTSRQLTDVGSPIDTSTIHCMCSSKSNVTDMNACQGCLESDPSIPVLSAPLFSWTTTCQADINFGDKQATLCWESQPDNAIPCYSNSDGSGTAGGSTNGGSGGTTTGASTFATGSSSSQSQIIKSGAMLSLQVPPPLLALSIIGFGVGIGL